MNNLNALISFFSRFSPWIFIKIPLLILLGMYVIFAAVLNRQVTLMNQVLEARFSPVLKLIAMIHLLIIVIVFFIALIFLRS